MWLVWIGMCYKCKTHKISESVWKECKISQFWLHVEMMTFWIYWINILKFHLFLFLNVANWKFKITNVAHMQFLLTALPWNMWGLGEHWIEGGTPTQETTWSAWVCLHLRYISETMESFKNTSMPKPHARPIKSESLEVGPRHLYVLKRQMIPCAVRLRNSPSATGT